MMPVSFPEANINFQAEGCFDVKANAGRDSRGNILDNTTCWQFNKEELEFLQRNGGRIWIFRKGPFFPMNVQVENPFHLPREMTVAGEIATNAFLHFHEDTELIFLTVRPEEKNFEVVEEEGNFVLYCEMEGLAGKQRTPYWFCEAVTVLGMESYFNGEHNYVLKAVGKNPATTLVLERVNKTERI